MPTDWTKLKEDAKLAIKESSLKTDEELASNISSLTRMTDEEIKELFPHPVDVEKLVELMEIVKSAENRNNKINAIVRNSEKFGGVVLTLLNKFT